MQNSTFSLILASSSKYRKMMLERFQLPFTTHSPNIDESPKPSESPVELAIRLSIEKAQAISRQFPGAIVIGSDQVATLGDSPIGKPGSFVKAQQQLAQLSGQHVQFHSALAVTNGEKLLHTNVITHCYFRELSSAEIDHYLTVEQPFDTAGSAKAEALGITLMERMTSDDPTAIIGLPLIALAKMLREFGINPTLQASAL
ncbi:Maf family nucleotide pyrophosphatase [Pelistega suis]|uniref:7-methyl-GTP pyrophosphatase n=1 Tax=Pelistega suis TaxID=1631957 RepID=A0A849P6D1_9BURK|nr:Maf family nucleotide pyrophosphatase [Pelistega suis]NOL51884.1 septum formation protein Maf [Pelistega suis]